MRRIVASGRLDNGRDGACMFAVWEESTGTGKQYWCKLFSHFNGHIVVENAEPLTEKEVFSWLLDHQDY